jgi:hypothetical protein
MVNHDVPHHLRGCRDKVGPALPDRLGVINQPQVGFVENGGGLQRVAGPLPAHVMVGEPVQFRMHQREQLPKRCLVSAAPLAEQLGDRLSRGWGRRHEGSRRRKLYHDRGIFTAQPEAIEKKLRSRGGSYAASSLTHMNRHKHEHAGKTKTESKP